MGIKKAKYRFKVVLPLIEDACFNIQKYLGFAIFNWQHNRLIRSVIGASCFIFIFGLVFSACFQLTNAAENKLLRESVSTGTSLNNSVWSVDKASEWYSLSGWRTGANYIASNAINQQDMWQKQTFSTDLIDQEFQLAEDIGFNTMRVFLHDEVWQQDAKGFKERIDRFLGIADKHHIKPMFVFFDDSWNRQGFSGRQNEPKVDIQNSGWLQDPEQTASQDLSTFSELEKYVTDILTSFKHDDRVLAWDLYNEPGNGGKDNKSLPLLKAVFKWAQAVRPDQPITAGLWKWDLSELNKFQMANSDIITYHDNEKPAWHRRVLQLLKTTGKPLFCTKYIARAHDGHFSNTLEMLKRENVSAIYCGFVEGNKHITYPKDSTREDGKDTDSGFHVILRRDYTPYNQKDIELIKKLNGKTGKRFAFY